VPKNTVNRVVSDKEITTLTDSVKLPPKVVKRHAQSPVAPKKTVDRVVSDKEIATITDQIKLPPKVVKRRGQSPVNEKRKKETSEKPARKITCVRRGQTAETVNRTNSSKSYLSDKKWICTLCKLEYGHPKDPNISDEWVSCDKCFKPCHETSAQDNGVVEDDLSFLCKKFV